MSPLEGPRVHLRVTDSTNDRAGAGAAGAPSRHGRAPFAVQGVPRAAAVRAGVVDSSGSRAALLARSAAAGRATGAAAAGRSARRLRRAGGTRSGRVRVKWPNDVWLGERKLAGVLIEARPPDWAVIGVGLNLAIADDEFPADLRWPATSLGPGWG